MRAPITFRIGSQHVLVLLDRFGGAAVQAVGEPVLGGLPDGVVGVAGLGGHALVELVVQVAELVDDSGLGLAADLAAGACAVAGVAGGEFASPQARAVPVAVRVAAGAAVFEGDAVFAVPATIGNLAISAFRRNEAFGDRLPRLEAVFRPAPADTHAEAVSGIALERCWRAIGALPPQQHAVAVMRWLFAMTNRQIAAALGIADGTVAAHLSAVRGKLKAALGCLKRGVIWFCPAGLCITGRARSS